jgi:hypothetical protein
LLQTGTGGQGFLQTGGLGLQGSGGGSGVHGFEQLSLIICDSSIATTSSAITKAVKAAKLIKTILFIICFPAFIITN